MDLKLTDGDIVIDNGALVLVTGKEAIAQDLTMAWSTWLGESVYDTSAGVPYLQVIFKEISPNLDAIRLILKQIGERRAGVNGIALSVALNPTTDVFTATGTADTIDGEIDFTKILGTESLS